MEQTVFVANPTRLLIAAAVGIIVLLLLISTNTGSVARTGL